MIKILPPDECPSCDSPLMWNNNILYCTNTTCGSQVEKRIEYFAKTLKIKGLGPVAVSKLELNNFQELYDLSEAQIAKALNSARLAEKLLIEIEKSKTVSLNQLLPAFSIRLIGKTASDKLSFVCDNITEINKDTCEQAGLGPKATENLLIWLKDIYPTISGLPFSFTFDKVFVKKEVKYVCISGKLKSYKTKALATEALLKGGYGVKSTLTKQVSILINESGIESAKTKKARDSGITVITNISDLLGENI